MLSNMMGTYFPGWIAVVLAAIVVVIIIAIALYIYTSLVWMTIARKLKYDKPWLAWIPIARWFLIPILAKKHWTWGFMFLVPIANIVFYFIWTWNIYERRKYPGWLALLPILIVIPVLGFIALIANLVVRGIVAWADQK